MYHYKASLNRVVNGDTLDVDVDLGFYLTWRKVRIRLVGPDGRKFERPAGVAARERVEVLLKDHPITAVRTYKAKAVDSFGRWVASRSLRRKTWRPYW